MNDRKPFAPLISPRKNAKNAKEDWISFAFSAFFRGHLHIFDSLPIQTAPQQTKPEEVRAATISRVDMLYLKS
jgi:hypothetical protein